MEGRYVLYVPTRKSPISRGTHWKTSTCDRSECWNYSGTVACLQHILSPKEQPPGCLQEQWLKIRIPLLMKQAYSHQGHHKTEGHQPSIEKSTYLWQYKKNRYTLIIPRLLKQAFSFLTIGFPIFITDPGNWAGLPTHSSGWNEPGNQFHGERLHLCLDLALQ